jgi:hypothetical protein
LAPFTRQHEGALVRVLDGDGRFLATGFFIATVGYAAAALPAAKVGDGLVVELGSGGRRQALVLRREDAGPLALLAVVAADDDEVFPSLRLAPRRPPAAPAWLLALCHDEQGALRPAAGGLRAVEAGQWRLDLPCGPGSPVLEADGVVIALVVRAVGRTGSVGAPVERLLALSRDLPQQPPAALPEPAPLPGAALPEPAPLPGAALHAAPPAAP